MHLGLYKYVAVLLLLVAFCEASAQTVELESDTIKIDTLKKHSPTKASLMSTVLPGLGQVYNKKYWKVPVIYAGLGATVYFGLSNHKNYTRYRDAYVARIDDDASTVDEFDGVLSDASIESNMNAFRRNRDYNFLIGSLIYVANIIDASVDAHLFTFPKNDKLTFDLRPSMQLTHNNELVNGFSLVVNL